MQKVIKKTGSKQELERDHLFINYAIEDKEFAHWLGFKLTNEGYNVWCDKFKLLGGESYPKDITDAIKNKTFRFIALLSASSINKDNPVKERTLAYNISRERKEDFVIPLNVDGLKPEDIDFMSSDITYITFYKDWSGGLHQLLKKLDSLETPKPLPNGKEMTAKTFFQQDVLSKNEETVYSNVLKVKTIPSELKEYIFSRSLNGYEQYTLGKTWPHYKIDNSRFLSFDSPNVVPNDSNFQEVRSHKWRELNTINGIKSENIVKSLLYRSIQTVCLSKGLEEYKEEVKIKNTDRKKTKTIRLFFPKGLLPKDKITFKNYHKRKVPLSVCGRRIHAYVDSSPEYIRYHLSPYFSVKKINEDFFIQILIQLHITDDNGFAYKGRAVISRRKTVCKVWWNNHWLSRVVGISSFLGNEEDEIIVGHRKDNQVVIDSNPLSFKAPYGINENKETNKEDENAREQIIETNRSPEDYIVEEEKGGF